MDAAVSIYSPSFIEQVLQENELLRIENAFLRKQQEDNKNELLKLQLQLHKFAQMIFGKKGERFIASPGQLTLDLPADTAAAPFCKIGDAQKISYTKANSTNKRELHELGAYMKDLPHVYETREPDHVPQGAIKIGEEKHETLEHTPGKAFVKVVIIPKYKVPYADDIDKTLIIAAPAPERPLFKCLAGASLLAMILVDKYCDHLPLFRQAKRFNRNGLALPYNTIVDLNARTIDLITPLYIALKKEVLASSYMHADETGLKVLFGKENQKHKNIHAGFLWCYHNSIKNLVFFDYQQGRGEKCTEGILKDFKGFLQTDGWQVYKNIASKNKDIIQICCWAHARRKFVEALPYDKEPADFALKKIGVLYEIERHCKEHALSYDEIAKLRQDKAVPILNELHAWMTKTYQSNLPSSNISSAIGYALERWQELSYYINDGSLKIDNNPVERSIRPIALGRKNYMFAGSQKGAERLAIIYSLIGTCTMNNVDPYEWLKDVIGKIKSYHMTRVHELLPHNWKKSNPESVDADPIAP
jgi:transposase